MATKLAGTDVPGPREALFTPQGRQTSMRLGGAIVMGIGLFTLFSPIGTFLGEGAKAVFSKLFNKVPGAQRVLNAGEEDL